MKHYELWDVSEYLYNVLSSKPLHSPQVERDWKVPPPLKSTFWIRMTTGLNLPRRSLLALSQNSLFQVRYACTEQHFTPYKEDMIFFVRNNLDFVLFLTQISYWFIRLGIYYTSHTDYFYHIFQYFLCLFWNLAVRVTIDFEWTIPLRLAVRLHMHKHKYHNHVVWFSVIRDFSDAGYSDRFWWSNDR